MMLELMKTRYPNLSRNTNFEEIKTLADIQTIAKPEKKKKEKKERKENE